MALANIPVANSAQLDGALGGLFSGVEAQQAGEMNQHLLKQQLFDNQIKEKNAFEAQAEMKEHSTKRVEQGMKKP